ncbi:MAG: SufD family Fe-S cluster assembly protein [Roseburia sp.]|nr:SufD family Fe-S cluster assembly protein [Anaeroplasma bactoclasticum]MCM1196655.1 SufD family Fe-S cluster assembly protein [Roseburia sp.]MCM1557686.1 SufD family Fe-S cluster assembly protein [Anaeroplasma bactoclasticum]
MLYLNTLVGTEGYGLSLHNNILTIKKSLEDFLVVDSSLTIIIEEGVSIRLLDTTVNQNIVIQVKTGAHLNYQILNSKNTNRKLECLGEVNVTEICLEETKENLLIELLKEHATASVELLSLSSNTSLEFNQRIEHKAKETNSNISNFGVALNKGEILFDTTGQILKGMAKSRCVQLSKGIVMDNVSNVTSKPILLIDEYDVVANHGASIGKMSDESLFYLMSRGLTKQEAFLLILEGIVHPFIEKIADEKLKLSVNERIEQLMKR